MTALTEPTELSTPSPLTTSHSVAATRRRTGRYSLTLSAR